MSKLKWSTIACIAAALCSIISFFTRSNFYSLLAHVEFGWFIGIACICGTIEKTLNVVVNIHDKRPVVISRDEEEEDIAS